MLLLAIWLISGLVWLGVVIFAIGMMAGTAKERDLNKVMVK